VFLARRVAGAGRLSPRSSRSGGGEPPAGAKAPAPAADLSSPSAVEGREANPATFGAAQARGRAQSENSTTSATPVGVGRVPDPRSGHRRGGPPARFDDGASAGLYVRHPVDPALQQREAARTTGAKEGARRRTGNCITRAGLHGSEPPICHAGGPETRPARFSSRREREQGPRGRRPLLPPTVHIPDGERHRGQDGRRDQPSGPNRGQRVAEDDPDPCSARPGSRRRRARKARLLESRAPIPEPREDARRRPADLQQHEDELKGPCSRWESRRPGTFADVPRARPAEGCEEEEREDPASGISRDGFVKHVCAASRPGDALKPPAASAIKRAILTRSAQLRSCQRGRTATNRRDPPKPSARALAVPAGDDQAAHGLEQVTRPGLAVAASRNHVASIRFRGNVHRRNEERDEEGPGTGLCTASPEPVRSAAKAPEGAPKASPTSAAKANSVTHVRPGPTRPGNAR